MSATPRRLNVSINEARSATERVQRRRMVHARRRRTLNRELLRGLATLV